jgi:hypothetical protein
MQCKPQIIVHDMWYSVLMCIVLYGMHCKPQIIVHDMWYSVSMCIESSGPKYFHEHSVSISLLAPKYRYIDLSHLVQVVYTFGGAQKKLFNVLHQTRISALEAVSILLAWLSLALTMPSIAAWRLHAFSIHLTQRVQTAPSRYLLSLSES